MEQEFRREPGGFGPLVDFTEADLEARQAEAREIQAQRLAVGKALLIVMEYIIRKAPIFSDTQQTLAEGITALRALNERRER